MEKKIFEYSDKKEVHLHSEVNLTKGERKFGNIIITICYFFDIITWILFFAGIFPFFMLFVPFILPVLFLIYLTIKYFVLKKSPIKYESYNIKVNDNNTEISDYKEKIINEDKDN